jgi:spermidine/putrescine transport system substrate-binding protein
LKKIASVILSVFMLACCLVTAAAYEFDKDTVEMDYSAYSGKTLTVFNWGEYMSDGSDDMMDVNAEFEALTGIKVNYVNFETNEDMYAKIKGGGSNYDVIIPSDYMIARMAKEGMLEKLDYSKIPNYKYIDDAYISGLPSVTIIHGRGEGILRKGIHEALKKNKSVKEFKRGGFDEGGDGVTVVKLKSQ